MGVDISLLVNSPAALDGPEITGIVATQIAEVRGFEYTVDHIVVLIPPRRRADSFSLIIFSA